MLASTWMDMVVGLDVHFEMVPTPAGPVPTPFPNPFIGLVIDPIGLATGLALGAAMALATGGTPTGPVLINCMPATNVGTEAKGMGHILIPPGAMWMPMPKFPKPSFRGPPDLPGLPVKPEDDAVSIMGSATVTMMGSSAVRMGELWMSCGEPLRLPSSTVIAIPKGPLVLVGGPPAVNLLDALLAMIKTKWVAGYLHSLISRVKNDRLRNILHFSACFLTGHPVDVASGRMFTSAVDFELGGQHPLIFERTYVSSWSHRQGPLGPGWSHSLDQAVWFERGKVVYLAEDGREIEFDVFDLPDHVLRPGQEVYEPINQLTLRFAKKDLIEIETHDGETREFTPPTAQSGGPRDGWWRLTRRRFPDRHQIVLSYDQRANLQWVRDSGGRVIGFEHDAQNRLVCVRLPHPQQDGFVDYVRYYYDADGDLVQVTDALGASWTFAYKSHLMVRETNRNGLSFYFAYDGWGSDAYCVRTWGDGGIYDHLIEYSKGQLTVVTNSLGHKTAYKLNPLGQVVEVLDARGGSTKYEYDERTLKKTKETDPLGAETKTEYDARGNVTKIVRADGSEIALEYGTHNRPVRAVDPLGGEWRWDYDLARRMTGSLNSAGERTQFHWGEAGLVAVTDPMGQQTQVGYNAAFDIDTLIAPDGATRTWTYDRLGRVATARDPSGNVERRYRDLLGRVIQVDEPDGNVRQLTRDREGNVVAMRDQHADVRFEYSGMNRLAARSESGVRVEFHYDTEDQPIGVKNEHGLVYRWVLDPVGDILEEYGFDGLRRQHVRDKAGRTLRTMRPAGRMTEYGYDGLGRLTSLAHDDGTKEVYEYRPDGVLAAAENATTRITFERDPLGRILKETQGPDWVASRYDVLGRRTAVSSSKGLFQRIRHNGAGSVIAIDAEVGGIPVKTVDVGPSAASDKSTFHAKFERDQLGRELQRELPGGIRARWQRDSLGRPVRQEIWQGHQFHTGRQYVNGLDDRVTRIIDAMKGPIDYRHDALGKLVAASYADGNVDIRMPDAVGNLFRTGDRGDRSYGPAGQLLETRGPRGVTRYEYDAEGYLVRKIEPDGGTWLYSWDGGGMLAKVTRPDGEVVAFTYDPLSRRTSKTFRGRTTRWIWDGNVPLHEWVERAPGITDDDAAVEAAGLDAVAANQKALKALLAARPANGPPAAAASSESASAAPDTLGAPITWLFEPETFKPLAKLVDGRAFSIVGDHLGTPRAMFDGAGLEVWSADVDAYGQLRDLRGEREACPFRWPGQYEDSETGLYYNRFRYYDPEAGQYVRQDPVGLYGGLKSYAYVDDPTRQVDELGLASHSPGVYDSFFEAFMPPSMFRDADPVHFREANRQLYNAMNNDPALKAAIEARYPGTFAHVTPGPRGGISRRPPPDLTWHHHGSVGGMIQLVDRFDHNSRHLDYHPNGIGGRNTWGGGTECR